MSIQASPAWDFWPLKSHHFVSILRYLITVRPILVSGIGRYSPVLVGIVFANTCLSIGADTSSPVFRLPVSTVNTVATHAYSFKPIPYFRAYTPHTYITWTHLYPTQNLIFSTKNLYSPVSVSVSVYLWPIVSGIGHLHGIGLTLYLIQFLSLWTFSTVGLGLGIGLGSVLLC